ncbi:hypothetical protein [Allokutzneria sp. A3M-2-11 16]|nr:hypothetical protein [Allokutzneria sp. A3M-2-11 16]
MTNGQVEQCTSVIAAPAVVGARCRSGGEQQPWDRNAFPWS